MDENWGCFVLKKKRITITMKEKDIYKHLNQKMCVFACDICTGIRHRHECERVQKPKEKSSKTMKMNVTQWSGGTFFPTCNYIL